MIEIDSFQCLLKVFGFKNNSYSLNIFAENFKRLKKHDTFLLEAVEQGLTHVVRRAMLSIKRFGDEHLPKHRVDAKHLIGWLIRSHPSDAVSD